VSESAEQSAEHVPSAAMAPTSSRPPCRSGFPFQVRDKRCKQLVLVGGNQACDNLAGPRQVSCGYLP
jgi:hypothetical protein